MSKRKRADSGRQKANGKDRSVKWFSLEHNGVHFLEYDPLPEYVKMKYDGKEVNLKPNVEAFVTLYVKDTHVKDKTFNDNFFRDFKKILSEFDKNSPIKEFDKCDFKPISEYFKEHKVKRKVISEKERKCGTCYLNGDEQRVVNFRIKPSIFIGRGNNPKSGSLKFQVQPEQITINIGVGVKIPKPPKGHQWGKVIHDNTVTWLARWKDSVSNGYRYTQLAPNSALRVQVNYEKFEKARKFKSAIKRVRKEYTNDLKSEKIAIRQRATALYFIDRLLLRVGYKKQENEVDTVGCCLLRSEHIRLDAPNIVHLNFLGKSSIRFKKVIKVRDQQVHKNLSFFKKRCKNAKNMLFNEIDANKVNKYLKSHEEGLTARFFRTYNASFLFQSLLKKHTRVDGSKEEKISVYEWANYEVAKLLNHKHTAKNRIKNKGNNKISAFSKAIRDIKETNTQTSKVYYIDPRISVAWCLKNGVPFDEIHLKNIPGWAKKVNKDWVF